MDLDAASSRNIGRNAIGFEVDELCCGCRCEEGHKEGNREIEFRDRNRLRGTTGL